MSEELMELPSYIKERWKAIEKARTSPNPQYAIKLPPTYEDVVFSDDERFVYPPASTPRFGT